MDLNPSRTDRAVVLTSLPADRLAVDHFAVVEQPFPGPPGPGEALCRTLLLSISPGSRAWMQQRTYRDRLDDAQVMAGYTLSRVLEENGTDLEPGQLVFCDGRWEEHSVLPRAALTPLGPADPAGAGSAVPLTHHLSLFGPPGLTAWVGMHRISRPQPGATVVVSAAAGATGSIAAQIARIAGARVVGIAGGGAKTAMLTGELGLHAAIDRREADLGERLAEACPDGVDLYFDNVGGEVLGTVLDLMKPYGRVVCCGAVASYDGGRGTGPANVPTAIVTRRVTMQGFIVFDHADEFPAARAQLTEWAGSGELRVQEEVRDGLDAAPGMLVDLLAGRTTGKTIVRVAS